VLDNKNFTAMTIIGGEKAFSLLESVN